MMNKAELTLEQVEKVNGGIKIWVANESTKYDAATATANAAADDDDNFQRIRIRSSLFI